MSKLGQSGKKLNMDEKIRMISEHRAFVEHSEELEWNGMELFAWTLALIA